MNKMHAATILLVEDNDGDALLTEALIRSNKMINNIDRAHGLSDAINHLKKVHYDFVFIDIMLEDGSGILLLEHIDTKRSHAIMLTGSSDNNDLIKCAAAGAKIFVEKPLTGKALHRILEEIQSAHWQIMVESD